MRKSIKIPFFILTILICIILIQIAYVYSKIDDALIDYRIFSQSEKIQKIIKNYEVVECKFSLFRPIYSMVAYKHYSEDRQTYDVAFYSPIRPHILSTNWQIEYIGGTTIENTTFPELVEMVKDDCSQFQKAKGDPADTTINWSYSPYKPEPPKEPKVEYTEAMAETMRARAIEIGRIKRELEKQKE